MNFLILQDYRAYTLLNEDIYSIIDDIIDDYKNDNQSIVFEKNFEQKFFEIKIDKSQISRVFQNLIINSIHSIEEKSMNDGKITFKTKILNNQLFILIKDNGIGLKYEKDELIKPYFTTKKRLGGSGLGLAIVEKILFDHNADFSIENRSDGFEGAEVEIKI